MSIDPELLNDGFWEKAFQADDPFRNELKTEFRRGVVYGGEDDLRWGRMAIPSITDEALWPLLSRLIELAVRFPGADFVEGLVFFLSQSATHQRLQRATPRSPSIEQARHLVRLTEELVQHLMARRDFDLADDLAPFRALLRTIAKVDA
ncbi:hypothetical protein [Steroidobacter cummioxidans]|uniref:hypothetical protein n=1 Tax=Steroidobacter cummioxidans TaxID=1803913 RepID=UPI0012904F0E|nr:hypothetical protein [Steroidobacter cummioxidans]